MTALQDSLNTSAAPPLSAEALGNRLRPLLQRYGDAVPRYTSYPPIPYWGALDGATVEGWLQAAPAREDASLSLYTHIPFCESRCYYCGCFVVITPHQEPAERYLASVHAEMERTAALLGPRRAVRQYHLGGGTPNFISREAMAALVGKARSLFHFLPDAELSIEADPRHLTPADVRHLRTLGFNRLSMGVQDFDPDVQAGINRRETPEHVGTLMAAAREEGFAGINLDLIYGLPGQTRERFRRTVERVIALAPDRLALYHFAYLPNAFPHQRKMDEAALPDSDEKLAIFLQARDQLLAAGYEAIGLDHFARKDDELAVAWREGTLRRNFMGYTTQAGTDLLGFGLSAISEFQGAYWQNEKKLVAYQRRVATGVLPAVRGMRLDAEDRLRQEVVGALFCQGRLDLAALGQRTGADLVAHFAPELAALAPLEADGLLERDGGRLTVSESGQFFLRNIAVVFDNRTRQGAPVRFSRSV